MTGRYFGKILFFLLIQHSKGQTNSCGKSLKAVKDSVLILSDDLVDANTAKEKCSLLGGNLAMTDDPQINTSLTQLMTEKYTTDLQRVYVFYDPGETKERYKYSYNSTEVEFWKSAEKLGHLWYFDLYKSKPKNTSQPIFFCDAWAGGPNYKWGVTIGKTCQFLIDSKPNGWTLQFSLFSHNNTAKGQKEIHNYFSDYAPPAIGSYILRNVNETYENFVRYNGSFLAPNINVFVGARYNTSLHGWYWSDGSPTNFPVSNVTTCQQGALHYGIGWEQSSMKCNGEPGYYACQAKLTATVEKFECNASTVVVNWTGLDQFINKTKLTAEVEVHILELNQRTYALYADLSTTIRNLNFANDYNIKITTMLSGCLNFNVSASKPVSTYGNPPSRCYPPVKTTVETFPCNASIVVVSWTGLDQFINNNALTAQVEIYVQSWNETISVPYSDSSTTVENLLYSTSYDIRVTVFVTGSITTNILSNLTVTTPGNPPQGCFNQPAMSFGMIAALVVGALLLVLTIVGLVVLFRRRRNRLDKGQLSQVEVSNHQSPGPSPPDQFGNGVYENLRNPNNGPTTNSRVTKLFDVYKKNAESGLLFSKEFKSIVNQCKNNKRTREVSQLPQNAVRNRYKNIYPYDHARVVLQGTGENDYINAAYIPGYDNERKFIATQGPKKETINDFWWMVWQENSNIIVMLTGLRENGKTKCEQYWPTVGSETKLSPEFKVQTQQETDMCGIVQRQIVLSKSTEQRTITQLHYTAWPDHGIPVTTSNMIYLRNMVDSLHHTNSPIIVHCSAGVGRTGTYIAMDTLFHELDDKGTVDVPRTVLRMRENRIDMIQNQKQYMYVYKLLMEHESLMETDKDVAKLQSMTSSEINKTQEKEFETLSGWRFGEEWQENHPQLRTYKNTSVKIWDNKSQAIQQLDASYIEEHGSSERFIAARNPAPEEEENFWKTVVDKEASLVVDLDHGIRVAINAALQYEDISLSVLDVNENKIHSVITVTVSSLTNAFAQKQLIILQVKGWSDVERPPEEMDFVTLIEEMHRLKAQQKCKCVLVGCSNGSTRTGTFIALVNILERLKSQKRVDVFRTVKDLRDMKPNMVNNKELYKYCYSVVMQYLSDFDTYSNYK